MSNRLASILLTAALSLSLAACKKDAPTTTPAGDGTGVAAGVATCDDVGANARAELAGSPNMDAGQVDAAADALGASCNDDAWPEEARKCAAEAKGEQIEDCKSLLSAEVAAKLDAQMEAIFDGGGDDGSDDY